MSKTRETWEKVCDCERATASGPRIVLTQEAQEDGSLLVTSARVGLACDHCDTPWRHAVEAASEEA
jgi:hypothetical protein